MQLATTIIILTKIHKLETSIISLKTIVLIKSFY